MTQQTTAQDGRPCRCCNEPVDTDTADVCDFCVAWGCGAEVRHGARTGRVVIERTCTAVWDGWCGLDARHPIRRGDRVGHSERGWLCTACTKAGAR